MSKKQFHLLSIFSLFVLSAIVFSKIYTLCFEEKSSNNLINATIYDNSQYNLGGDGLSLTSDGVDINGWDYNVSKYLQINVAIPNDNKKYIVKIKTAKEIYFVTSKLVAPTGFSNVSFTKNENITVNTNSTYSVNDYSGTALYTVASGITSATIQLELKYDSVLWNKQNNTVLNNSGEKALTVELQAVEDDNNVSLTSLNVNTATSGIVEELSHGLSMTVNNVLSTTESLEMVYDKDNPDILKFGSSLYLSSQDAANLYFKKLKVVVNLPYYTQNGKKYYLDIKKDSLSFSNVLGGKVKYDIDDSKKSSGIITINLYDLYISSGGFLTYQVVFPNDLDSTSDSKFAFTNGSSAIYVVVDDKDKLLSSTGLKTISYNSSAEENVLMYSGSSSVPYTNTSDTLVNTLGGFYLYNSGTGDSEKKHIDMLFDNSNTGYIKVTTVNIPTDRTQSNLNITYRLVDDNNTLVCKNSEGKYVSDNDLCVDYKFNITLSNPNYSPNASSGWSNISLKFYRGLLPVDEQKYYFKEIIYDIDKIKAGALLYSYQSDRSYWGTGNYYGFINYHDTKMLKYILR